MNAERFIWLYERLTQIEMKGQAIAALFVLIAREELGLPPITKVELGALIGVQERQVANILLHLESGLSLIEKRRHGGAGKGRVANTYVVKYDATGNILPAENHRQEISGSGNEQNNAGNFQPAKTSNQQQNAGSDGRSVAPVACGELLPPIKEHASARAETLNLNTNTSELYPDTAVCVVLTTMPIGGGELDLDWVISPDDRAFANERGFLNGSCDELFGQFLDHCATKGPRMSASWRSEWRKWVRNQVKFDTERAQRAKATEANHDQQRTRAHSYASAGRGRARSVETEILMRDIADGAPEPVRRLDFSPSK